MSTNIAAMQSLNLSGQEKKRDGVLKSLFWPTVDNAWDVDYLGQQGFWICLIIGLLNLGFALLTVAELPGAATRIFVLAISVAAFFVYFVGGMGVRESSWPAAALIFVLFLVGFLANGGLPGIIPVIIGAVLLSNARATYLASHWSAASEDEDRPTRFNETFRDKLVDQLPPRLWPILKIPFFIAAALLFLFLFYASILRFVTPRPAPATDDNAVPSIAVQPPDAK